MEHLRKVREGQHDNFIDDNKLNGGFFTSAQSGDNVTTVFYDAAAKAVVRPIIRILIATHETT